MSVVSGSSASRAAWSGAQVHSELFLSGHNRVEGTEDKNNIVILDSGSTVSLFKSRNLVTDIREADVKIELGTNVRSKTISKVGNVNGMGEVYFNENGIANIFAVKD